MSPDLLMRWEPAAILVTVLLLYLAGAVWEWWEQKGEEGP
jgi:hypothetical protein